MTAAGLLLAFLAASRPGPVSAAPPQAACPDCNVILVSIDALRADALGVYGGPAGDSPNLDRLARRGAAFRDAFVPFPNTLSSHMSMMTAQYPWVHGVRTIDRDVLSTGTVTLAMALKGAGYRTVWAGMLTDPYLSLDAGFERGFDDFVPPVSSGDCSTADGPCIWTHNAVRWIESHRGQKFFMFLHTYEVHAPYRPYYVPPGRFPKELGVEGFSRDFEARRQLEMRRLSEENLLVIPVGADGGARALEELNNEALKRVFWSFFDLHDPRSLARLKALYRACVFEADLGIGRLYRALEELGLADKTLLVITADHGEEFLEHGNVEHRQDYVETMHVPLIFAIPGGRIGRRPGDVVRNIDIMPTVLELSGIPRPASAQGVSLVPLIEGDASAQSPGASMGQAWFKSYSIRDGRHTYIIKNNCTGDVPSWNPDCVSEELYDRRADPGERKDIHAASPAVLKEYNGLLIRQLRLGAGQGLEPWPAWASPEEKQRVMDTGYW